MNEQRIQEAYDALMKLSITEAQELKRRLNNPVEVEPDDKEDE